MRFIVLAVAVQCFASAFALPSLLDLLAANNATTLLQLVNQAGLADVLRSEGKPDDTCMIFLCDKKKKIFYFCGVLDRYYISVPVASSVGRHLANRYCSLP